MARVLILEDEETLRTSMVRGLARLPGIEVVDASTVAEALVWLSQTPIDLILSDIDLPDRSGLELIGELQMRRLTTPIVFISAYLASYRSVIPTHARIDVREKPVPLEELRAIVLRYTQAPTDLGVFSVADYLQLAVQAHRSVAIDVDGGGLVVVNGEPWTAFDRQGDGTPAFQRIALSNALGCRATTLPLPPRTLFDRWDALLFEAARLHDEAAREGSGTAVPLDDEPAVEVPAAHLPESDLPLPPTVDEAFASAWNDGVEALIGREYHTALGHFLNCDALKPGDRRVATNLKRLNELGIVWRPVDGTPS